MHAPYRGQAKAAKTFPDKNVGRRDTEQTDAVLHDDLTDRAAQLIRTISPTKPAEFLAFHGDIGKRQAERILSGRQSIWPVFKALLGSKYASRFHWVLMESYGTHEYWDGLRHDLRVANLKEQRRAIDDELRGMGASK